MLKVLIVGILLFFLNRGFHGAILSGKLSNSTMAIATLIQFIIVALYLWWALPKMKKLDEELRKRKE